MDYKGDSLLEFEPPIRTKRDRIVVFLYNKRSPSEDDVSDLENRCTITELQNLKNTIRSDLTSRRIKVITFCIIALITFLCALIIIPYHIATKNLVIMGSLVITFLILGAYLIIINMPLITKKAFLKLNSQLEKKGLVLIVPYGNDKIYKNYHFELWNIEVFEEARKKKYNQDDNEDNKEIDHESPKDKNSRKVSSLDYLPRFDAKIIVDGDTLPKYVSMNY